MNRLNIYLLVLAIFLVGTAEFVVAGVLNFIADDLQISVALAGQLITAFSLAFAIGTPIVISLASRMSRKKLLLSSLAVFVIGCAVSFLSSAYSVLLVARIILGVSAGVFSVVAISSVTKLVPPEQMGSAISMISLAFGMALTAGVPIGIAISNWWNWQTMFLVLGLAAILIMVILLRLFPQVEGDAPVSFWRNFGVLKNPIVIGALCFNLFLCVSHSIMLSYITPYLKEVFHLDATSIGTVMLVLGIAGIVGSRAGGYSTDKWGTVRTISLTSLIATVSLALLPLVTIVMYFGLTLIILWAITVFMNTPAVQAYFIQQQPQSANFILSLNTSVSHLGLAVGAAAGGWFVDFQTSVQYHPWLGSTFYALSLLVAIYTFTLSKRKMVKTAI